MGLEFVAEAELTRLVHSTPALQIQMTRSRQQPGFVYVRLGSSNGGQLDRSQLEWLLREVRTVYKMRILIAAIAFNQSDSLDDAEPMCIALKTVPAHVWKSCERLGCAVAKSDCSDAASFVEHTRSFSATAACKKAIGRPSEYTLVEHASDAVSQVTAWVRSSSKPELRLHVRLNGARIRLFLDLDSPRLQACTPSMALPMMDTHHHSSVLASLYVMADIAPNDHVLNLFAPPITFLEKRILRDGDRGIHVLCVNADCAPSKLPIRPVTTSPPIEQLVCAAGGIGAFRTNVQVDGEAALFDVIIADFVYGLGSKVDTGALDEWYREWLVHMLHLLRPLGRLVIISKCRRVLFQEIAKHTTWQLKKSVEFTFTSSALKPTVFFLVKRPSARNSGAKKPRVTAD